MCASLSHFLPFRLDYHADDATHFSASMQANCMPVLVNCAAVFFLVFFLRCHLFLPASPNYGAWVLNGQSGCDCVSSLWKSCYCFSDLELHVFNFTIMSGQSDTWQTEWPQLCTRAGLFHPARWCYIYAFHFLPKLVAFSEFQLLLISYISCAQLLIAQTGWKNYFISCCLLMGESVKNINANRNVCASIP